MRDSSPSYLRATAHSLRMTVLLAVILSEAKNLTPHLAPQKTKLISAIEGLRYGTTDNVVSLDGTGT